MVKIWIHAVWATKKREKVLTQPGRNELFSHIHNNAMNNGIFMDCVNGYMEHVHCLLRLRNDQSIDKVIQQIKGEASMWCNRENLLAYRLEWQRGYYAVSVSESIRPIVRNYILRQEEHHSRNEYADELDEFGKRHGIMTLKDED